MTILSQRDPRWANIQLGDGSTTIGQDGCFITCIAMLLNRTPDVINQQLKEKGGYAGDNKNEVNWTTLSSIFPGITVRREWSYNNEDVKAHVPVLVQVDGSPIGGTIHAVVFIGNHQLYDPWDGTQKSTAAYPVQNYAVIKGSWNQSVGEDVKINEIKSAIDQGGDSHTIYTKIQAIMQQ